MNTVTVNTSSPYCVQIGHGLLPHAGSMIAALGLSGKAAIISDSNVWPLYGELLNDSLKNAGFECCHFFFKAGEESKNGATYLQILNFLAQNQLTRSDVLIALGGGVVGDMAGFAAATYLRGIRYVQIPTSLLAMVDSSVGGKTAIDLDAGKNLAGAFYQPGLVLCDPQVLDTLSEDVFRDGCAEVIKYAVLFDADLFSHLKQFGMNFLREDVITKCICHKRNIVCQDEFDKGQRQLLNLGHTIGHAIERCSNYQISHGFAVAAGLQIIAKSCVSLENFSGDDYNSILSLLQDFDFPVFTEFSCEELFSAACNDKKRSGDSLTLVLPLSIGKCTLKTIPLNILKTYIQAGL